MKFALCLAAVVLLPVRARAERAKSPADATVFIRLAGSLHADVEDSGIKRAIDVDHVEIATGSGFVISPFGYVMTNNHVVVSSEQFLITRGMQHIKITTKVSRIDVCFPQGTLAAQGLASQCTEATVSAADPALDLAVLFINRSNLPYVALGDSDAVAAGAPVDALGYPFGRDVEVGRIATARDIVPEISMTPGAVSALRAGDAGERRFLQITNSLNPGNSGGPLVDRDGFAVGVIAMKLTGAAGIGFAVPVNAVKDFLESHGVDQLMPVRRLRLGPVERLETKGLAIRLPEGMSDISTFRSHVETDGRSMPISLRIDRVFSPWNQTQLEQALVGSETFERLSLAADTRRSTPPGSSAALIGRATGTSGGHVDVAMKYAIVDLDKEKIVARYVGSIEQMAFNESVLQESLTSLEAARTLSDVASAVDKIEWSKSPGPAGLAGVTLPARWVVESNGPSACRGLPQPSAATSTFQAQDFTVVLRVAVWPSPSISPDAAAAACSSSRGPLGTASYGLQGDWLGVAYFLEGAFTNAGGQLLQLEVVAPDQKRAFAHALLEAWIKKTAE